MRAQRCRPYGDQDGGSEFERCGRPPTRGRLGVVTGLWPAPPIGRAEILAQARARLSVGESVMLTGPAGIGKSTILDALAHEAAELLVLRAAAAEAEADLPYLALVDLLNGA